MLKASMGHGRGSCQTGSLNLYLYRTQHVLDISVQGPYLELLECMVFFYFLSAALVQAIICVQKHDFSERKLCV